MCGMRGDGGGEGRRTCLFFAAHMRTMESSAAGSKYVAVCSPLKRLTLASISAALACTSSFWSESSRFSEYVCARTRTTALTPSHSITRRQLASQ